eukprot:scaffold375_cov378-Prasinococcus_capsulatus_cf.AAC.3
MLVLDEDNLRLESEQLVEASRMAAQVMRSKLLFATVNATQFNKWLEQFHIEPTRLVPAVPISRPSLFDGRSLGSYGARPTLFVFDYQTSEYYTPEVPFDGKFNTQAILQFAEDVVGGKLEARSVASRNAIWAKLVNLAETAPSLIAIGAPISLLLFSMCLRKAFSGGAPPQEATIKEEKSEGLDEAKEGTNAEGKKEQ